MPVEIQQELQAFLISAFWGMLLVVYYDFFRILRILKKHAVWMVAVEDLLYGLACGCVILAFTYRYMQGQVRIYILLGMACGAGLYTWGISPYLCGAIRILCRKVKIALKKISKRSTIKDKNPDAKEGKNE